MAEPQDRALTWGPPTARLRLLPATGQMPQEVMSGIFRFHWPGVRTQVPVSRTGCALAAGWEWEGGSPCPGATPGAPERCVSGAGRPAARGARG